VSPYGLWCVETRAYPGRITGAEYDYEWVQLRHRRTGQRQARRFFNPVRENASHCASIGDHLTRHRLETAVRSMVVFTAAEVETMTMTAVESLENMVHTILTAAETRVHEAHEVERIVGVLAGLVATSPRSRGEDAAATEAARLGAA